MLTAAQNFTAAILTVQSVSRAIAVLHSPCVDVHEMLPAADLNIIISGQSE